MRVTIDFECEGFNPMNEEYIRYVLTTWMEERGLFEQRSGEPIIKIKDE